MHEKRPGETVDARGLAHEQTLLKRALAALLGLGATLGGCAEDPMDSFVSETGVTQTEAGVSPAADAALASDSSAPRTDANVPVVNDSGAIAPVAEAGTLPPPDAGGVDSGAKDGSVSVPEAGMPEGGTVVMECPAGATLKAGNSAGSLMVGSVKRDYLMHVPASYTGRAAVPLVLDFHPLLMDAAYQRTNSGYAALADKEGFIVAYPDGVDPAWNVGPCCTKERSVDDLGFAKALVAKLKTEACVDAKRVYAVGFSNGGGMAHHVACNAADVFAAVAPASFDLLVEAEQPCHPVRPISVLAFRSTNDNIVPYAGGASSPPTALLGYTLGQIHFLGAQGTFTHWAELNKCTDTPGDSGMGCKTYKQCAAGVEVTLCTSPSDGHKTGPAAQGWATLKRFTLP
jgi:polyhydroxybutyrate depolymerase